MLSTDEMRQIRRTILENLQRPHIWEKMSILTDGRTAEVNIQDLKEKRYNKAISFLHKNYLTSEHLCKTMSLTSCPTSVSHFLYLILTWIKDGISLEAVVEREPDNECEMHSEPESKAAAIRRRKSDESGQEIVGLLVCRVAYKLEHTRTFSRIRIPGIEMDQQSQKEQQKKNEPSLTQSDTATDTNISQDDATTHDVTKLDKILKLRSNLAQLVDIYEHYDIDKFLQICIICIHPDWHITKIGELLAMVAYQQATHLNLKVAMGIFTSYREQQLAREVGMRELAKVSYKEWNDGSFADDHYQENNAALIMAMIIRDNFPNKTENRTEERNTLANTSTTS